MKLLNILIVEDDRLAYNVLNFLIGIKVAKYFNLGAVLKAESVHDVVIYSKNDFSPDIIFLDLNLPDSTGKDTYLNISKVYPKAKIIVVSGLNVKSYIDYITQDMNALYLLKDEVNADLIVESIELVTNDFN
jgi:DNA-binding NarL/FixJ family response regulator